MALEFTLKLQDLIMPKLGASVAAVDKATARMEADMRRVSVGSRQMGASFDQVKGKIEQLREIAGRTTDWKIFKEATQEARKLENQLDSLNRKAGGGLAGGSGAGGGGIMGMLGSWGKMAAVAAGIAAISFTKNSLEQAAQLENRQIAFKVLTGSKYAGNAMINQLQAMADVTPYESADLGRAAKQMMAFGLGQNRVMPMLKNIGDIASAQDDSKGALQGLAHAYGETVGQGHLMGRDVMEMVNNGFNPVHELSIMTGRSMADLDKIMEKGGITIAMVDKAFEHATGNGGKFHDMMKEQSETLGGKWSTFMDLVHTKMRNFGESLSPIAKGLMDFATKILNAGKATESMEFDKQSEHLRALRVELGLSNITNDRRKQIFDELKANYPDIVKGIDNEKDALTKLMPALDAYNNKRYMASGILKLREKYADDLTAYGDAQSKLEKTHGNATSLVADLAGKYGVNTDGMSAGQAQIAVQNKIRSMIASGHVTKYTKSIAGPGGSVNIQRSYQEDDLNNLVAYIEQNKDALANMAAHKGGFNEFNAAQARFNKIMGINDTVPGTGKATGTGAGGSDDLSTLTGGTESAMSGQRTITINIRSFIENFNSKAITAKEGYDELEQKMTEHFLRIVNSAAGLANN